MAITNSQMNKSLTSALGAADRGQVRKKRLESMRSWKSAVVISLKYLGWNDAAPTSSKHIKWLLTRKLAKSFDADPTSQMWPLHFVSPSAVEEPLGLSSHFLVSRQIRGVTNYLSLTHGNGLAFAVVHFQGERQFFCHQLLRASPDINVI